MLKVRVVCHVNSDYAFIPPQQRLEWPQPLPLAFDWFLSTVRASERAHEDAIQRMSLRDIEGVHVEVAGGEAVGCAVEVDGPGT